LFVEADMESAEALVRNTESLAVQMKKWRGN